MTALARILSCAALPKLIEQAGPSAAFAWDEFFAGQCPNRHTRRAYQRAVTRFLAWLEPQHCPLARITPGMIGHYFDALSLATPSKKLHLAALRKFFDLLVIRHVIFLNPAASVRGMRYRVLDGATPAITPRQIRQLLESIPTTTQVGLRDRAILACLAFTAARVGAIATLTRGSLQHDGGQYRLCFLEKNGCRRDIPVRHDLEQWLLAYLHATGLHSAPPASPMFRSLAGRRDRLTEAGVSSTDIWRMVKRRLRAAGLPTNLSPHSFRVAVATDLLSQAIPLEDVQFLLGHADPRTTRLYDRRTREVTRNLVERISA